MKFNLPVRLKDYRLTKDLQLGYGVMMPAGAIFHITKFRVTTRSSLLIVFPRKKNRHIDKDIMDKIIYGCTERPELLQSIEYEEI